MAVRRVDGEKMVLPMKDLAAAIQASEQRASCACFVRPGSARRGASAVQKALHAVHDLMFAKALKERDAHVKTTTRFWRARAL
jgi:hypothetical protein